MTRKQWSKKYQACINCNNKKNPHLAKGLCKKCYNNKYTKNSPNKSNERGVAEKILTKDKLIELYINNKMSIGDIGRLIGTTRPNVYYKLKKYGIPLRTKKQARNLALKQNKICDKSQIIWNKNFFGKWSSEMVYVLGLMYTDGNLHFAKKQYGRMSFGQKDPELVEKVLKLMQCNVSIKIRIQKTGNKFYYFTIQNNELAHQLQRLGINPNKSLTMKFPYVPIKYRSHFIRGCWDGDGSVYVGNPTNKLETSFVSGSSDFIKTLKSQFESHAKLKQGKIYKIKNVNAYFIKYRSIEDLSNIFHYFYENVPEDLYYSKKYELFKKCLFLSNK